MSEPVKELFERLDARPENWRREMLSLYRQGAFDREIMIELDLTPYQWEMLETCAFDRGFREVVELGRVASHAWWETQGRKNLFNNKFNTQLYKLMMGNHFGWSDKSETSMTRLDFTNKDDKALQRDIEELYERLMQARGKTAV